MVECIVLSLGLVHNAEIVLSAALRMMCHHVSFCGPGGACSTGLGDFALGASSGTDVAGHRSLPLLHQTKSSNVSNLHHY